MNEQQQKEVTKETTGKSFQTLKLLPELLTTLREIGYESMFPIQEAAIPPLLEGKDVIGQAHTGSGKTAAFALPILQRINPTRNYVQALILVPTRELALQVTDEFNKIGAHLGAKAFPIYGGQAITPQIERLQKRTPQVVVATPGRLIDHIERETIDLQDVQTVILDEADRMLDMGFIDDVEYIMRQLPSGSQTALFSATMPPEIMRLSHKFMSSPVEVLIDSDELSVEEIDQMYALVDERSKFAALTEYVRKSGISSGIVFCSTKIKTQKLAERLQSQGFKAAPIHGDLSQNQREHAMRNFRSGHIELLVATDVAARGIDVPAVSHVINYDVPQDPLTYFHRIGRTARAGKAGQAVTLVSSSEYPDFTRITGMTEKPITRVTDILPEGYRPPPPSESRQQFSHPRSSFSRNPQRRFSRGSYDRNKGSGFARREESGGRPTSSSSFSFTESVSSSQYHEHSRNRSFPPRGRGRPGSNFSSSQRRSPEDRSQNPQQRKGSTDFHRPRRRYR
ncbi:MAG TPA: DEAD/DEAH box helicase [Nitrososphaerales archaeon]|nr:DEAD/DEAH box helicase [Nitrososphaerales archaeon]